MAITKKQKIYIASITAAAVIIIIGAAVYMYIRHMNYLEKLYSSVQNATPENYIKGEDMLNVTESTGNTIGPTKECLRCLCQTVSGCQPVKCANQPPCGIYAISKWYWADVGRLKTTEGANEYTEEDEEFRDYLRCVNDEKCASATVRNYLQIYGRDCNDDGKIDCEDYISLHLYGPTGCKTEPLKVLRKLRLQKCKLE